MPGQEFPAPFLVTNLFKLTLWTDASFESAYMHFLLFLDSYSSSFLLYLYLLYLLSLSLNLHLCASWAPLIRDWSSDDQNAGFVYTCSHPWFNYDLQDHNLSRKSAWYEGMIDRYLLWWGREFYRLGWEQLTTLHGTVFIRFARRSREFLTGNILTESSSKIFKKHEGKRQILYFKNLICIGNTWTCRYVDHICIISELMALNVACFDF